MKKVSVLLVAVLFLSVGSVFANNGKKGEAKPSKNLKLSEQIATLLNQNQFTENDLGYTAEILFMLNNDNEIIVLSVDTDKTNLDGFIKNKLNYKKVALKEHEAGKKYTIKVKIAS